MREGAGVSPRCGPHSAAMERADLIAVSIAQVGEIKLAKRAISPARRIFDALAAGGHAGFVEGSDLLGAVAGEADGATIGVGRILAVDGFADRKYAGLGAIEDATLGIGVARGNADGAEHGIVELLGGGDIIGPNHDVREHCFLSYLVRREPSPETRLAARSWAPKAHVARCAHALLRPQRSFGTRANSCT